MIEEWRSVTGWDGLYEVSSMGRVRRGLRILSPRVDKVRRQRVSLCRNAKAVDRFIHTLVLEAFIGKRPAGFDCCHNDGNPSNNELTNLRWDTKKANQADRVKHGTMSFGEKNPASKLTADQVERIRIDSRSQSAIAKEYGIVQQTVSKIKNGHMWKRGVMFGDEKEEA